MKVASFQVYAPLVFISVRGWVDPRDIMRPKVLIYRKIQMAYLGIESEAFQHVRQCLNCTTACPVLVEVT